jgi:hypothetical protein
MTIRRGDCFVIAEIRAGACFGPPELGYGGLEGAERGFFRSDRFVRGELGGSVLA